MSDAVRLPGDDTLVIHFAHVAYRLAERFALRGTGIAHFQTWSREDTLARVAEGHVLVLSGFWSDEMLDQAANLRFIQVCAAGYERFGLDALRGRGVRLANGRGVNRNAVSDHAMALLLAARAPRPHRARPAARARVAGNDSPISSGARRNSPGRRCSSTGSVPSARGSRASPARST